MKRLTLIKTSRSIQLGHLYEHIYYAQIVAYFWKKHLYQHLDYLIQGETYNNGVFYIRLVFYTQATSAFIGAISTLDVEFDKDTISTAATQILAEKELPLESNGINAVQDALEELHSQPWKNIDGLHVLDTKTIRKTPYPFYIAEGDPLSARKLTMRIVIEPEFIHSRRELLPLFREVGGLIHANLRDVLSDKYGYYAPNGFAVTKNEEAMNQIYKVAHDNDASMKKCLETAVNTAQELYKHHGFARYMAELRKNAYFNYSDQGNIYHESSVIIGSAGWRELATNENCDLILKHTNIEVQFGRQRLSSSLLELQF